MPAWVRWVLGVGVVAVVVAPPVALFRAEYATAKRFREVSPGRFYRSGQMTAGGMRAAIQRHGIKTVINLQHEDPDPLMPESWMGKRGTAESALCKQLDVRYVLLTPDILPEPNTLETRPPAINEFLTILDDEASYPILLHCKAGKHRTGRLTAIYRMEYEGWTLGEAMKELRANDYGFVMSGEADAYIIQFVQNYKPRAKGVAVAPAPRRTEGSGP